MDPEAPRGFRQVTEEDDPIFQGDRLREDRLIIGDPAHCIEEIRRYREALSINHLILRTQFPGLDQKKVLKSIELFAKKVMPHFREDN